MTKHFDKSVEINPDHFYRIFNGGSGSGKTNVFELNKTSTTRYWQNWFICQRFISIKESIAY